MSSSVQPLTWFITGAGSGFGLALSLHALRAGHAVVGTVRTRGGRSADAVRQIEGAGGRCVELDVGDLEAVPGVVEEVLREEGRIDVLVNMAGYSLLGAVEDVTVEESQAQMQTNFFGPLRLIQAVLPHMRERRSGTLVNVSSAAGIAAIPGCGLYSASKFALEGLTESLHRELAPLNIAVLLVEPGAFGTNFAHSGVTAAKPLTPAYVADPQTSPMAKFLARMDEYRVQGLPGDSTKGARVIFEAVAGSGEGGDEGKLTGQLLRLPLGSDCVRVLEMKIEALRADLERARGVAVTTDKERARRHDVSR